MKTKDFRRFVLPLALLLGTTAGYASTISYYVDVFGGVCSGSSCSGATVNVGTPSGTPTLKGPGFSASLQLPQFVPGGNGVEGTPPANYIFALSAVSLSLNWSSQGSLQLLNVSCYTTGCSDISYTGAEATVTSTLSVDSVTVTAPGNTAPTSGSALYGCFPDTAGSGCGPTNYLGSQSPSHNGANNNGASTGGPYTVITGLSNSGTATNNSADLSYFVGNGSSSVAASVLNGSGTCAPTGIPNLSCSGLSDTGAFLTVTYTYGLQAVPEPLTSALSGSALIGLALLARRKRSRKA